MKKAMLLGMLILALVLGLAVVAYAATPQDIFDDFAADGDLDGTYTRAELRAYLRDATLHQYGPVDTITDLDKLVRKLIATTDKAGEPKKFPFTGFEMLLALGGGIALIGGGLAVRRQVR